MRATAQQRPPAPRRQGAMRRAIAAAVCLAAAARAGAGEAGRSGSIQFSDGESVQGRIQMSPGRALRLHTGRRLEDVPVDTLREIRFSPTRETMERNWRFETAGQTHKTFWGEPYPVRHLQAALTFADDRTATGQLYTTSLYLHATNGAVKFVLFSKQRGEEGSSLADLVYPVRVAFEEPGSVSRGAVTIDLEGDAAASVAALATLTFRSLARLEGVRLENKRFSIPPPHAEGLIPACAARDTLWAAWPDNGCAEDFKRVRDALPEVRDFFDERTLLGVHSDPDQGCLYSLLMLFRKERTSLHAARSRPWRLGVWRWRTGEDGALMLAGRGYLFRGIVSAHERPPPVRLCPDWWQPDSRNTHFTLTLPERNP